MYPWEYFTRATYTRSPSSRPAFCRRRRTAGAAVGHMDLSVIGIAGLILLIGIVKKNGIMLVDFAIVAERDRHMTPVEAIREACLLRFRPILMTTAAAMLAGVPLASEADRLGTTAASRLRDGRRSCVQPIAHALHDAGDLSLSRAGAKLALGKKKQPPLHEVETPPADAPRSDCDTAARRCASPQAGPIDSNPSQEQVHKHPYVCRPWGRCGRWSGHDEIHLVARLLAMRSMLLAQIDHCDQGGQSHIVRCAAGRQEVRGRTASDQDIVGDVAQSLPVRSSHCCAPRPWWLLAVIITMLPFVLL